MKYYLAWCTGSTARGDRNGGWLEFDTLDEARMYAADQEKENSEYSYILIEGVEIKS